MAGSNFADEVRAVLSDTLNLPAEFLNYVGVQFPAQNILPVAKTSGQRLAVATHSGNVSTTGLTFSTGTDVLSSPIEFTASGSNDYIVRMFGHNWSNSTAGDGCQLRVNIDGADGGGMGQSTSSTAGAFCPCVGVGYIVKPPTGKHSVNVRLVAVTGGTATIQAGSGSPLQAVVTLEVA